MLSRLVLMVLLAGSIAGVNGCNKKEELAPEPTSGPHQVQLEGDGPKTFNPSLPEGP